jgi:hypothetical protein
MRSRWLILVLSLAGSLGYAADQPKLGTFNGNAASSGTVAGRGYQGKDDARKVHMQLRVDRNRLYVSRTESGVPGWRQSFVVKSDQVLPTGERVIDYERPDASSRSGKYNEAQFKRDGLAQVTGAGKVIIRGNTMEWVNTGQAMASPKLGPNTGITFPFTWDEQFQGKR